MASATGASIHPSILALLVSPFSQSSNTSLLAHTHLMASLPFTEKQPEENVLKPSLRKLHPAFPHPPPPPRPFPPTAQALRTVLRSLGRHCSASFRHFSVFRGRVGVAWVEDLLIGVERLPRNEGQ